MKLTRKSRKRVQVMDKSGQNTHNVITMTQHVSENGFAPLSQVEAYWEALRGSRLMPSRADIDPRGIENALEYSFIVERIAPGIARLRIAGSHLSDLMGMEVRGMPLTAFITPNSRRQLSDTLEEVFETPAVCTLELESTQTSSQPPLKGRLLLMPLKSDLGDVSRILGAFVTVGDIGRSPRRFDVLNTHLRPIINGDTNAPAQITEPVKTSKSLGSPKASTPGFAEPRPSFQTETPRKDAPYLRLVKSDD